MTLLISAPDWCFLKPGMNPAAHYARLKALGYDAAEMVAPENRAAAQAAGLTVLNLSGPGMAKGLNRLANHAELLPQIRNCIKEAAAAGVPHVIVFSGNREGQGDAEGQANCVTALRALAPDAAKAGVTLVFEMLNGFDHGDYQADRSAYGFAVARAVASPNVRVLYDIYHMARMGDDPAKDVTANLDLIVHLHLAETPNRTVPQAAGAVRYRDLAQIITKAGYKGYWGMEFIPGADLYADLAQAAAAVRQTQAAKA
jgi:hydroxypyruvate isomerase